MYRCPLTGVYCTRPLGVFTDLSASGALLEFFECSSINSCCILDRVSHGFQPRGRSRVGDALITELHSIPCSAMVQPTLNSRRVVYILEDTSCGTACAPHMRRFR